MKENQIIIKPYFKLLLILDFFVLMSSVTVFIFQNSESLLLAAWVLFILSVVFFFLILFLNYSHLKGWFIFDKESVFFTRKKIMISYFDIVTAEYINPTLGKRIKALFSKRRTEAGYNLPGVLKICSKHTAPIEVPISEKKLKQVIELSNIQVNFVERLSN